MNKLNYLREGPEKMLLQRAIDCRPRGEGIGKKLNSEREVFEKNVASESTTCAPEGKGLVEDSILSRVNNFRPEVKD